MPTIEPFPGQSQNRRTTCDNSLPDGVFPLPTSEGEQLYAICCALHISRLPNTRHPEKTILAPKAINSLLSILRPYEEVRLKLSFASGNMAGKPRFSIRAVAPTPEHAVRRGRELNKALVSTLQLALPGLDRKALAKMTGKSRESSNNLLPCTTEIIPQGLRLPLDAADPAQDRPHPRLASEKGQIIPAGQEIIFPPDLPELENLPLATGLLADCGMEVQLELVTSSHELEAVQLRRLYAARAMLEQKSAADFLKNATLPFKEMGGHDYLTALLRERTGMSLRIFIHSAKPLDEVFVSMISQLLWGAPLDDGGYHSELDLRAILPPRLFFDKGAPALLLLIPAAFRHEKTGKSLPHEGILLGHTASGKAVRLPGASRKQHTYIIGSTGTGKSTLIANMIRQDMEAGRGVILFDPHGDLWQQARRAVPENRRKDLILAHLGNSDNPFTMNILAGQGGDPAIERNTVTNELIELFKRVLYSGVPEAFGPMFEIYFRNALMLLMNAMGDDATIMDFERIFDESQHCFDAHGNIVDPWDDEYEANPLAGLDELARHLGEALSGQRMTYRRFLLERCTDDRIKAFWRMAEDVSYNEITISNIAPYIVSKLTQITGSPLLAPILGAKESTLDFRKIMDEGKICLINLAKGEVGAKDAAFAGGLMSIRLAIAAQSRSRLPEDRRRPVNVYMDEFQTYATDMLSDMLAEMRKYGLRMVLANQTLSQIDGQRFKADASGGILGNAANLIVFRVGIPDAEILARWLKPHFMAEELADLPNFTVAARLLANDEPLPPMSFKTLPPA